MKLQFKHQAFQREAVRAVTDIFQGQPRIDRHTYTHDTGMKNMPQLPNMEILGYGNFPLLIPEEKMLENVRAIQADQYIRPAEKLLRDANGMLAFSIEMETGTGKTYTYLKTIYELHKLYGWTKYIIVVPSIAIREGVLKSLVITREHFENEYSYGDGLGNGPLLQSFVYDSRQLKRLEDFATSPHVQVMVINTQAFNATGKDARRISTQLEEFGYRKPIDAIAETNPILIIDEPQSVLGADRNNKTREGIKRFNPLFALLYSATHRPGDIYNQVYRLDAMDAYNRKLVKKIEVVGIEQVGTTGTNGFLYLDAVVLAKRKGDPPRARIEFDVAGKEGLRTATRLVGEGVNLYTESGGLEAYRNGFTIERIDASNGTIRLSSGVVLEQGQVIGNTSEEAIRRIQIRSTIESHLKRERQLHGQGIKVLSLFFIDRVEHYRAYDPEGTPQNGRWAEIFEQEYLQAVERMHSEPHTSPQYLDYLNRIEPAATHQGYFSVDKKNRMVDCPTKRGEMDSSDTDAYDLIMRNKEQLLSLDEPVRFIFSHSALREGWDNPNVFQICTLKQSSSEVKKRQEVGRGMRLCVNQHGERQDEDLLGKKVFDINILTIIASESYANFAHALQTELAEAISSRPTLVNDDLFESKTLTTPSGQSRTLDRHDAADIVEVLLQSGYVDGQKLTPRYVESKLNETLDFGSKWNEYRASIVSLLESISRPELLRPENARQRASARFMKERFDLKGFQTLWQLINRKTYYTVDFDTETLTRMAIEALDRHLHVTSIRIERTIGSLEEIASREALAAGRSMRATTTHTEQLTEHGISSSVTYDLIGELVARTGLKRKTIREILTGVREQTFNMFRSNPEEFIIRAANIINAQKGQAVIGNITYHKLDQVYSEKLFMENEPYGHIGIDAIRSDKSLYNLVVIDSEGTERRFAEALEAHEDVEVYTKLPREFSINTPIGKYNPDWAIVFRKGSLRHIYFVAETKGSNSDLQLRMIEEMKIRCAERHFAAVSDNQIRYSVVADYETLYCKAMM